jgi:outer membrane protein
VSGAKLLIPLALICSGCAVDEAAEVATYEDVLQAGVVARDPQVAGPVTVIDSMRLANARNESLAIEGENYLQALIAERRAAAAFLPTISLAPSYTWRGRAGPDDQGFDTSVDGSFLVNPVRDLAGVRAAEQVAAQRLALLLDVQDALLLDVARVHYEVVRAERAIEVLENSLTVQEERVRDARGRFEAGVVRALDVSLVEAQAAQTGVDLIEARNAAETNRASLAFLTVEPVQAVEIVDSLALPALLDPFDDLVARAHGRRPDIVAAERAIDAAQRSVESAYGEYFPSVSLNLQVFLQRETDPTDLHWSSLVTLSIPLFSAGLIEQDVREALSILRQSRLFHHQLRRAAVRDVEVAIDNLSSAIEREHRLEIEVASSQQALDQADGLFQAGLGTNLERLVAQDRLLSAQLQLVNAELDAKVFYLDLLRVTGALHELLGIDREAQFATAVGRAAN